jgi:hypothetical protein
MVRLFALADTGSGLGELSHALPIGRGGVFGRGIGGMERCMERCLWGCAQSRPLRVAMCFCDSSLHGSVSAQSYVFHLFTCSVSSYMCSVGLGELAAASLPSGLAASHASVSSRSCQALVAGPHCLSGWFSSFAGMTPMVAAPLV